MSDAVAVLTRARDMVAGGWVQNTGQKGLRRCSIQAITDAFQEVTGVNTQVLSPGCPCVMCQAMACTKGQAIWVQVVDAFQAVTGCSSIPDWNDKKGRTQEQVVAAFDKAIRLLTPKPVTVIEEPVVVVEEKVLVGV